MLPRKSKEITVGAVTIGGGAPISIQSMTTTDTSDSEATLLQIKVLQKAGCELIRCAVPNDASLDGFAEIATRSPLPVIADIHFRADLAINAIKAGAHKIRINPGNIGSRNDVESILKEAAAHSIPIRIGVNSGSLEQDILEKHGHPTGEALAESLMRHITFCEESGFTDLIVSIKSTSLEATITANRIIAAETPYPIHLGITEAGRVEYGTIKSSIGIGILLMDSIGDTIRVSLAGSPLNEIPVARNILKACGKRTFGPEIIACPTCARCHAEIETIAAAVEEATIALTAPLKIAVMGCEVNGPGEAAEADIGIACGSGKGTLFVKGQKIRTIKTNQIIEELMQEIESRFSR